MTSDSAKRSLPKAFGQWTVIRLISSRPDSNIYLAANKNVRAAIKVLKGAEFSDDSTQKRFHQEIFNLQSLNHPGVPKIFEFDLTNALNPWMAIEYVEGENLEQLVNSKGVVKSNEWLKLLESITETLAYVHSKGIYHRDISPSNIIINDGIPRLIDFGLSYIEDSELVTKQGDGPLGTPATASPESFLSKKNAKMDMFSLASTFIFAGTGRFPFESEDDNKSNFQKISFEKPNFYDLSQSQIRLLTPLLFKNPNDRISSKDYSKIVSQIRDLDQLDTLSSSELKEYWKDSEIKLIADQPKYQRASSLPKKRLLAGGFLALLVFMGALYSVNFQPERGKNETETPIFNKEQLPNNESPSPLESSPSEINQGSSVSSAVKKAEERCIKLVQSLRYEDALTSCQVAADGESLPSMHNLGYIFAKQFEDKEKARYWYELAGSRGYTLSYLNLGIMEYSDNDEVGIKILEKCSSTGKGECALALGTIYEDKGKINSAITWLKKGMALGIGAAGLNLGNIYLRQDKIEEARAAYEFGSKNGDYVAQYNLGLLLWEKYFQQAKACKAYKESFNRSSKKYTSALKAYVERCKNMSWTEANDVSLKEMPISPYRSVNPDYYPGSWIINKGSEVLTSPMYEYWIQSRNQNGTQKWEYRYSFDIKHTNGTNGIVEGNQELPNECLDFRIVGEKDENVISEIWTLPKSTCKNNVDYYKLLSENVSIAQAIPANVKSDLLGGVPYLYTQTKEWLIPLNKLDGSGAIRVGQIHLQSNVDKKVWLRLPFRVLSKQGSRDYASVDSILVEGFCPNFRIIEIENEEVTRLWTKPLPLECGAN